MSEPRPERDPAMGRNRVLTIAFNNTFDDVLAFARFHYNNSDGIQRNVRTQRYGGVAVLLGYFLGLGAFGDSTFYYFIGVGLAVAWWVWIPQVLISTYQKQVTKTYENWKNKTTVGSRSLAVGDERLTEENEFGRTEIAWPAIERIEQDDDHTFIYLSAAQAHIIPKSRITDGDYDAFVTAARTAVDSGAQQ